MYIPKFRPDINKELRDKANGVLPSPVFGNYPGEPEGGELTPIPADEKINKGVYTRVFAKSIVTKELIEISLKDHKLVKRYPEYFRAYEIFTLTWDRTNPVKDNVYTGYLQRGSNHINYETLVKFLPKYPELFKLVTEDGSFLKTVESKGKGFKTRENIEYRGEIIYSADGRIHSPEGVRLFPIGKVVTEFDK